MRERLFDFKRIMKTCNSVSNDGIGIKPAGANADYCDSIDVFPGNEYRIKATFGIDSSEQNAEIKLSVVYEPEAHQFEHSADIGVIFDSTSTGRCMKYVSASSDRETVFDYKRGSARLVCNNGVSLELSDKLFDSGIVISNEQLLGAGEICVEFSLITPALEMQIEAPEEGIEAKDNDCIMFQVTCANTADYPISNISLSAILPLELKYVPGSTFKTDSYYVCDLDDEEMEDLDDIIGGGANIGTLDAGQTVYVCFYAVLHSAEVLCPQYVEFGFGIPKKYVIRCRIRMETETAGYWRASVPIVIKNPNNPPSAICTESGNLVSNNLFGPQRKGYHLNDPVNELVFNSVIDDPLWGDQRAFAIVRDASSDDHHFSRTILVKPGHEYEVAILYANNHNIGKSEALLHTMIQVSMPGVIQKGSPAEIETHIKSKPYDKYDIWAKLILSSREDVMIAYQENTAFIFNQDNWTDGKEIDTEELFGEGWLIRHVYGSGMSGFVFNGEDQLEGKGKGYIMFRFVAIPIDSREAE